MIELRHLRYFLAIAEELHFGRAAERLHIAQPGLSQQMQALERELGVRLLERTSRHVELTLAGKTLYAEGRRALAMFEQAEALTQRAGHGEIGLLTIAATEAATYAVLPNLLREYRRRYPQVQLIVRQMLTPDQIEALRNGDIDVGVMRTPADVGEFATQMILRDQLGVLVPEKHALAARRQVPLKALRKQPLIISPASPRRSWANFVLKVCREAGFEPHIAQEATDGATAASCVAAELGLALMPESLAGLVRPGVVYRRLAGQAHYTELTLVYRRGNVPETVERLARVVSDLWPSRK